MKPTEIELICELSPMQQAMLFHSLYAPGSGVYVLQMSLRLTGCLDIPAFERAWRHIVERHGLLRTAFFWEDLEKPLQVVYQQASLTLERESWSGLDAGEQRACLARYLDADLERGFDLAEAPLMRLALFELGPEAHQLVWTQHHLVVDGWSQGLILRELFLSYAELARGREPRLEQPKSFRDYIAWLQRKDLGETESFWRQTLAGYTTPTFLAGGDGRTEGPTWRESQRRDLAMSAERTAALREVARRNHLTLNTLVQGAWSLLLAQATGAQDVVFGATVAGRPADLPGVEAIVGPFINTLPVRVEVKPDQVLRPWLAGLQQRLAEVRRFEHSSLVDVQRWSELPGGVPLFDHILVFENLALPQELSRPLPELEVEEEAASSLTNYPLTVIVLPGQELTLSFRYDASRFDGPEVARILERLVHLLEVLAMDPDLRLGEIPLLLPAERHQVVVEWNDTAHRLQPAVCLHELFELQAQRTPEAVATSFEGSELTYRELESRASQLAGHLIRLGVLPDSRVGVLLERSHEMVVGLLGVLEAGAAYVPLDPSWPAERLGVLVDSSGLSVVLAQQRLRGRLPGRGERVVVLDEPPGPGVPSPSLARPPRSGGAAGESLAYVIYTSGSTGVPKGVMIPHRGIVNRLLWMQEAFGLTPEDRVLQKTPFSFDVSLWEFFSPLLAGARLVLARPEGHKDPFYLAGLIARERITVLHFVPSMLQAFLEVPGLEALTSLRMVLASGEALPPDLVRRFFARLGPLGVELHNLYGPTEASVEVSSWTCVPEPPRSVVPIGRPIANLRLHVVDRELRPQPIGVPGELLLGGAGLARGYLGRPELTAAAFLPDPFGDEPGGRLYRSGDLTRLLPEGQVEYLGRIDHQVKVRGFRIELGEIEAALAGHPEVRECVVLARQDEAAGPAGTRLVAYVILRAGSGAGAAPPVPALREHLLSRLPEHMVPPAFVVLDAFPLTTSGKVDRRALPAPAAPEVLAGEGGDEPSDPVEELLAGIWAEILRLDRVGRRDQFFALGGHSLLATRVVSRIREVLGVELPLRALFEAPTPAELARVVRELRDARPAPPIARVPRDGDLPLSFSQERLWFLEQLQPGSALYNLPAVLRLAAPPDLPALERALAELGRRHETLRTWFAERGGVPAQIVAPDGAVRLRCVDLRGCAPAAAEAEAHRLLTQEARRPFDLRRGALARACLIRLTEADALFSVVMHHIVSDGWSLTVFFRELATLYAAFSRGERPALPEPPIQYADYAVWQREQLRGERLEELLAYWRERLAGAPELLQLPTDHPRPAVQTHRGGLLPFELGPDLTRGLAALGRERGATLYMLLLAGFLTLLRRASGEGDLVVGTPVANRLRPETEGLIGFFVNTLALRVETGDDPAFGSLVERVREEVLGALAHQELPFEKLVEELHPSRNLSHNPLFQVMLTFQGMGARTGGAAAVPGTAASPLATTGTAKFDLSVTFLERGDGLLGALEYSADLFDPSTAGRLARQLRVLLAGGVEDPESPLGLLPLLTEEETRQLLAWGTGPRAEPGPGRTLHEVVEGQVARLPDHPAIVQGGRSLTYGEMGALAAALARRLRALGVGPEVGVALRMERCPEAIVAMLAVLQAGGFFVPLAPDTPPGRLAAILADSEAVAVVTRAQDGDPGTLPVPVLRIDEAAGPSTADGAERPRVLPGNLAYAIYTSGSTGQPKGVLIEHGAVAAHCQAAAEAYGLTESDSVLQFAALTFDASIEQIFSTLAAGARLVLREEPLWSPHEFLDRLVEHGISVMNLPPAYWREVAEAWAEEPERARGHRLRLVLIGGDQMLLEGLRLWRRTPAGAARILNGYGPTEATIGATLFEVPAGFDAEGRARRIPIGRAMAGRSLVVLDRQGQPVPVGIPGELHIGGRNLGRGYLGQPDLTAGKFVPDPFGTAPGGRLYRTGDLCRMLAGGDVEVLGRIDTQVKVRGFRIELGEIEGVLARHPAVRHAVVIVHEAGSGDAGLVAYVVPATGASPAVGELRRFLADLLPAYMVPPVYVLLDELPRTAAGKVDRRALPPPPAPEAGEPPAAGTETALAAIWGEVLKRERIARQESFFELGGHSLSVLRVASRIRDVLGVELPLRALFENPTLAGLAAVVEAAAGRGDADGGPPLVAVDRTAELPLSFAQERLWFLDRLEPGSPLYSVPTSFRLREPDAAALEAALHALARRQEVLRTRFVERSGRPAPAIDAEWTGSLEVVDLRPLPAAGRETEAASLAAGEWRRPFDLAGGPLLRARLVRLSGEESWLLLTLHHIATDAWSMDVLVRELRELYEAARTGRPARLPELPVQYVDFAVWQRACLAEGRLAGHLEAWRRLLAGAPQVLELPTDRPRPAVPSYRGATVAFTLPEETARGARELARREGATDFMVLLALFKALLLRYSAQEDLVVGVPVANRPRAELESLIGFFSNTLVLRTDLSRSPSLRELVGRVRRMALDAFAHQDLPFERLVEELQPERRLGVNPLFQVLFSLQKEAAVARMPRLQGPVEIAGTGTSKFDLSLFLVEDGEALQGAVEHSTDLFDGATVERLLRHFETLLEALLEDPDQAVDAVPLLTEAERSQVEAWNLRPAAPVEEAGLDVLFARQAAATPEAAALVDGEIRLGYGELDRAATALARRLRRLGAGPDVRIGLCLARTARLPVAVLAVLKAGGAYVPLDPGFPAERLQLMLADAGAALVVTEEGAAGALPEGGPPRVFLDREDGVADDSPLPGATVSPDQLAYVLYTSGSTGRPKGVAMPHRPLVNLLAWQLAACEPGPLTTLQFASPSFDVSFQEMFLTWLCGGTLVLAPEEARRDPAELIRLLVEQRIERLFLPFVALRQLADAAAERDLSGLCLREVITAGEALQVTPAVAGLFSRLPGCRLRNQYGPTETHVVTDLALAGPAESWEALPSIGRPVAHVQVWVLDRHLSLLPVGIPGGLYLGGVAPARGYLGRPELTAERFLPDPHGRAPGGRLYRTGDLGRLLPAGEIQFLGRSDFQVKVRGFRVEPGEVEAVLSRQAEVRQAVVVARRDASGSAHLIAYVVPAPGAAPAAEALRRHVREHLPEYMVPARFVVLEDLPTTATGKVDRNALPLPAAEAGVGAVPPRTDAERELARIFGEVLGRTGIGAEDHFFALGGHSLLAMQVLSRIRTSFAVELPVRTLFEAPTPALLAVAVAEARRTLLHPGEGALDLQNLSEEEMALLAEVDGLSEEETAARLAALFPEDP